MDCQKLKVALVQMRSTPRHDDNIEFVTEAVQRAAEADLVALPEVAGLMNRHADASGPEITGERDDPFILACRNLAAEFGTWIHVGSTPVNFDGSLRNRCILIDRNGEIHARYDKIHLFDIQLAGSRPTGESLRYTAGEEAVLADTPWGPWGLSICYDLRFPQLYREYARRGATVLFVPSAFTVPTGKVHWHVLLQARAIENGAWVIAAAQVGSHQDGRRTFGHSLIVNPWGEIMADLGGAEPGLEIVEIDLDAVGAARRQLPVLENEREYRLTRVRMPPPKPGA